MGYLILAGVLVAAALVGRDVLLQRRLLRQRTDTYALVGERTHDRTGPPDVETLVGARLRTPPSSTDDPWAAADEGLDIETFRPSLREDAEIVEFPLRWGDDYAMACGPDRTRHFRLEIWEAQLLRQMDGSRTVGELIVDHLGRSGDLDAAGVLGLIETVRLDGFFEPGRPLDVEALIADKLQPVTSARQKIRTFIKTLQLPWHGADRLMQRLYDGGFKIFFRRPVVLVAGAIAVMGAAAYISVFTSGRFTLVLSNPPVQAAILMVLGLVLTAAHELGHALVLTHNGRRVGSAGFMLYYGSPAFYVDASDGLMMPAGARIMQAAAGPFAEMVLAGLTSITLLVFPESAIAPLLFKFAFLNYYVIILNLIPLLELDGYWILTDAIEVQDLRPRSLAFVQREMWRKLRRRQGFTIQEVGLGLYGTVGIAFTIVSLVWSAYYWREVTGTLILDLWDMGMGARVLLVALILFLAGPVVRGAITAGRALGRRARSVWRRIIFRFEIRWRVEAAELIDALPAFDDLPVEILNDLAGRVALRTYPRGHIVFHRGDTADAFYVVRSGRISVEDEDPVTGDTRVISTLTRGDSFGELGLLGRTPRTTTIRAAEDAELFEIDRPTFDRLLSQLIDVPDFGPTMQAYAELKQLPPFRTSTFEELADLMEHGAWVSATPGHTFMEQGEVGDAFYVIGSGQVTVRKDGLDVAVLGPGQHFGEVALLEDVPRTASVIARTPVRVFRLDREGFTSLVADAFRRGALRRAADRTWQH
jgi:CRP-like cAMP-binding protein/Zn-dependent protease